MASFTGLGGTQQYDGGLLYNTSYNPDHERTQPIGSVPGSHPFPFPIQTKAMGMQGDAGTPMIPGKPNISWSGYTGDGQLPFPAITGHFTHGSQNLGALSVMPTYPPGQPDRIQLNSLCYCLKRPGGLTDYIAPFPDVQSILRSEDGGIYFDSTCCREQFNLETGVAYRAPISTAEQLFSVTANRLLRTIDDVVKNVVKIGLLRAGYKDSKKTIEVHGPGMAGSYWGDRTIQVGDDLGIMYFYGKTEWSENRIQSFAEGRDISNEDDHEYVPETIWDVQRTRKYRDLLSYFYDPFMPLISAVALKSFQLKCVKDNPPILQHYREDKWSDQSKSTLYARDVAFDRRCKELKEKNPDDWDTLENLIEELQAWRADVIQEKRRFGYMHIGTVCNDSHKANQYSGTYLHHETGYSELLWNK